MVGGQVKLPPAKMKNWGIEYVKVARMIKKTYFAVLFLLTILLSACTNSDPGPLAGNWQTTGSIPMNVQFRKGESETLGIIEKVSYEIKGNDVLVTSENGIAKGMTIRYAITGKDTVRSELGSLQRVK